MTNLIYWMATIITGLITGINGDSMSLWQFEKWVTTFSTVQTFIEIVMFVILVAVAVKASLVLRNRLWLSEKTEL